jgi:acetyl-CoA acyltransferase
LAASVVAALVKETGVRVDDIEDLLMGCAFPEAEQGFNLARIVANLADLPITVAGATLNRFCGSSMTTIHQAAAYIMAGAGDVYIAAGCESMSRIPMGGFNPMPNPALFAKYPAAYMGMGETAENLAKKYSISRTEQEQFALTSQQRASAARASGKFAAEIVPVSGVAEDGCIRPETTMETLVGLKTAFDEKGTVTAGTASPLTDGASAVLITSEEYARKHNLPILARIVSFAAAGCGADIMGIGPVPATKKALARAGLTLDQIDLIELNEAFGAQSLAVIKELGLTTDRTNIDGGAIALGHPLGASGARITGKLAALLGRENKKYGLATMCIGGGQGVATMLERV